MLHSVSLRVSLFTTPRLIGMAVLIAIGLTIAGGAAFVSAQRGEPSEPPSADAFQGCVSTHTGVLRIVDMGQACQDHETPIQLGSGAGDAALLERIDALEGRTDELEAENAALQQENLDQQNAIDDLVSRVTTLEANPVQLPACLTTEAVTGQERDDIVFEGCNVHVQSGAGATDADVNGLGNLIVGYNESIGDARSGSHNLVVGQWHSYTSYGGLVAGWDNRVSGRSSSVIGGSGNVASGIYSSVSGGANNNANGVHGSVTAGFNNVADAPYSSVSGGLGNVASGSYSSVSGGYQRSAPSVYDWRGGEFFSQE